MKNFGEAMDFRLTFDQLHLQCDELLRYGAKRAKEGVNCRLMSLWSCRRSFSTCLFGAFKDLLKDWGKHTMLSTTGIEIPRQASSGCPACSILCLESSQATRYRLFVICSFQPFGASHVPPKQVFKLEVGYGARRTSVVPRLLS